MDKLLGLYGGTFDPPHKAHLEVANAFLNGFEGASLTVMPCLIPPHKMRDTGGANEHHRLNMTKLCFGSLKGVNVSDYELKSGGTSYTYLTVNHLQEENPKAKICLVMGQDNLLIIEKWREYRYLLDNCVIAVAVRGGEPLSPMVQALGDKYGADIRILNMDSFPLSSTAVRRAVRLGLPFGDMVTNGVEAYIKSEGLYKDMAVDIPTEDILQYIQKLSNKRLSHTFGVEKAAILLAENHYPSLDTRLVSAAALLHDCTKELDAEGHRAIAEEYGVCFDEITASTLKLQHAVTGAAVAEKRFGLPEAAQAILTHTTAAPDMNPLAKIIYLADFIELGRKDELCISVREEYFKNLAENKETAIDKTLLFALDESIKALNEECKAVHPHTLEARTFIKESLADEDNNGGLKQ